MERFRVFDEDGNPLPLSELPGRRALQGHDAPERLVRYEVEDEPEQRWSLVSARPVFTDEGTVRFVVNVFRDVTSRQRTLRALHQSERRLAFLADTSRRLIGAAVDYSSVLERVAELFVPALADACSVREVDADGSIRRVATRAGEAVEPELAERYQRFPDPFADGPVLAQLLRGETIFMPDVDVGELIGPDADPEFVDVVDRLWLQSLLIVPLTARGETVGIVSLSTVAGGHRYDSSDVALVEEVARRAGLAVENARLFEERSTVATTLQRALLPPALPSIPGIELAARYRPAASEIGGDFYDVVPAAPSRWLIVVGDVSGKGIEAASITAMVRYTLRAFAGSAGRPSELLAQLNDALVPSSHPDASARWPASCSTRATGRRACVSPSGAIPGLSWRRRTAWWARSAARGRCWERSPSRSSTTRRSSCDPGSLWWSSQTGAWASSPPVSTRNGWRRCSKRTLGPGRGRPPWPRRWRPPPRRRWCTPTTSPSSSAAARSSAQARPPPERKMRRGVAVPDAAAPAPEPSAPAPSFSGQFSPRGPWGVAPSAPGAGVVPPESGAGAVVDGVSCVWAPEMPGMPRTAPATPPAISPTLTPTAARKRFLRMRIFLLWRI